MCGLSCVIGAPWRVIRASGYYAFIKGCRIGVSSEVSRFLEACIFLEQAARAAIAKVAGKQIKFGPQAFRTHRLPRHSLEARAIAQKALAAPQKDLHPRVPARAGFEVRRQGCKLYSCARRADVTIAYRWRCIGTLPTPAPSTRQGPDTAPAPRKTAHCI